MVAATISQVGGNNKNFVAHETTLLPNIRGFGAMMAMLFAKNCDLKRDTSKTRFISVRCGLGYNDDKECAYFAEHDTVFPLDFEFTEDDLSLVSVTIRV